ncbi:hypothetical protein LB456_07820 [Psychroflexus sp. CAK57W]|uniref:hypothetical protein n=1 Tax=Psychroflexus curvus TaxID=2873595 RepID=UPI001CCCA640|nr:hypothetical protein [Psychroflexus curvus]MBZ9787366.1 hypothetical protein [Psychroflexus curvus]
MKYIFIIFLNISLWACQTPEDKEDKKQTSEIEAEVDAVSISKENINKEFWNRLSRLKGKSFQGEVIEAPAGDDFRGKKLVMHVLDVKKDTIYIPFNVGENRSRTWILTKTKAGIQLKHDHRKEDGSEDEVTMYGGTTPNTGLEGIAMFPADQETVDLLPGTATNLWWITVDDKLFTYNLRRIGSPVKFSIGFDLESPIDTPKPSWGWEGYVEE